MATFPHDPAAEGLCAMGLPAALALTGLVMNGGTSPLKQAALEAAVAAGDWSVVSESGEKPEDESASGSLLKEVHDVAANLIILLALLHVAGVAVESRMMRRNLVTPMLSSQRDRRT